MKLPKNYQPSLYEGDIYSLWEKGRVFVPARRDSRESFSMVMPPPNANADLHIGFGLTIAVEDTIVRYQRMLGKATLFVPGADHAGFETQVVYEKKLNEQGKSRFDLSREELYRQVWDFVELNKDKFQAQIRAFGASCDWSRFTYTLDDKVVAQAYGTFQKMWHDGLIYRGKRIVNFCTFHGTSFSDIEVVHEREKTKLWYIAYPFTDGSGEVVIATTRPETKLGQSAIMVNPKDERYKNAVGKQVLQPLVPDKPIPIIADDYVDMQFGTGVVTVTPAHDPNDFEVARRHNLPLIELITTAGRMSDNVPESFRGRTLMETRVAVVELLEELGYLRKIEDYEHSIGKCYKCGTPIEPLLREQWFINMESLKQPALEALNKKEISFYPDSKRTQLIRYLEGLRDWNISRQIAWGIPIPAFQNTKDPNDWIFDTRVNEEMIDVNGKIYRRDPDVFDTWFSSSSWPYATLNYPDGDEFKEFYPLSLMETAGEILHQWVARMIMLGLYTTGKVPFKEVYIHGLVLAEGGAKMSKSLGNVTNATEVIAKYGADAMRMGLISGRAPAVNRGYDSRRVEEARNFNNKLWNVSRYIEDKVGTNYTQRAEAKPQIPADHWLLYRLDQTAKEMGRALDKYRLSEAYEALYHFIWHDFADWYVEVSKIQLNTPLLAYGLEAALRLAHPFAPFVTETIWQNLSWEVNSILAVQKWPQSLKYDSSEVEKFEVLVTAVSETRRIVSTVDIQQPSLYFLDAPEIEEQADLIKRLAALGSIAKVKDVHHHGLRLTGLQNDAWLDVDRETAQAYMDKLKAQQKALQAVVLNLQTRLGNADYLKKAPKEVVEQSKEQLKSEEKLLQNLEAEIKAFETTAKDVTP
jgi:valyl-tRNA synthetase